MSGGCIDIWRKEPLDKASKNVLGLYAAFLNKVAVSYTIRFMEPSIRVKEEVPQIMKAIGFIPKEEIVICGLAYIIFESAFEIMMKFGGYLRVGVTKELIPKTKGKAYQVKYYHKIGTSRIPYYYHILNCEFVRNYFVVGRDPRPPDLISLDNTIIKLS